MGIAGNMSRILSGGGGVGEGATPGNITLNPTSGTGTTKAITITGTGFAPDAYVTVDGSTAGVTNLVVVSATQITCTIATPTIKAYNVVVFNGTYASNTGTYTRSALAGAATTADGDECMDPAAGTVDEAVAYAQAHPECAQWMLDTERANRNRVTLTEVLDRMLGVV